MVIISYALGHENNSPVLILNHSFSATTIFKAVTQEGLSCHIEIKRNIDGNYMAGFGFPGQSKRWFSLPALSFNSVWLVFLQNFVLQYGIPSQVFTDHSILFVRFTSLMQFFGGVHVITHAAP